MKIEKDLSLSDVLFLAGLLLLTVGLGLWSVPLALVVIGVLAMAAGVWIHLADQRTEGDDKARAPAGAESGDSSSS